MEMKNQNECGNVVRVIAPKLTSKSVNGNEKYETDLNEGGINIEDNNDDDNDRRFDNHENKRKSAPSHITTNQKGKKRVLKWMGETKTAHKMCI